MIQILSYAFCFGYVLLIFIFFIGWENAKKAKKQCKEKTPSVFISLIIPFRNESEALPSLLKSLKSQTYNKFEIVFVDDHSTDESLNIITEWTWNIQVKRIQAIGRGKKNALREGISASSGELIVCTDADCIANDKWLEKIAEFYSETNADLIIAPVMMVSNKTAFEQMQALEFMSLQASTAGAACVGMPIMCNGANLAFKKHVWDKNKAYLNDEKLSGDDMFLMLNIKKNGESINYLKSIDALVYTSPSKTLSDFFNQRKRWVSKSTSYKDISVILSAFFVVGVSFFLLLNLFLGIFLNLSFLFTAAFIFICKIIFDSILLYRFSQFFKSRHLLKWIFPLSLIYPFYIIYSVIFGLFGHFEWKERKEKPTKY